MNEIDRVISNAVIGEAVPALDTEQLLVRLHRSKRRRLLAASGATSLVVVAAVAATVTIVETRSVARSTLNTAAPSSSTPKSTEPTAIQSCDTEDNPELVQASAGVPERAGSLGPIFAGQTVDSCKGVVRVFLTRLEPAAEQQIIGSFPADSFQFELAANSSQALASTLASVTEDLPLLRSQGIQVRDVRLIVALNRVVIRVVDMTSSERADLEQKYGATRVIVEQVTADGPRPF